MPGVFVRSRAETKAAGQDYSDRKEANVKKRVIRLVLTRDDAEALLRGIEGEYEFFENDPHLVETIVSQLDEELDG